MAFYFDEDGQVYDESDVIFDEFDDEDDEDDDDEYDDEDDEFDDEEDGEVYDEDFDKKKKRKKKSKKSKRGRTKSGKKVKGPFTAAQVKALKQISYPRITKNQAVVLKSLAEAQLSPEAQKAAMLAAEPKPYVLGANLAAPLADREGGWLRKAYGSLVKYGVAVVPLNRSCNVFVSSGPLRIMHNSIGDLLSAARIAVAGATAKSVPAPAVAEADVATAISFSGKFFGWLIRVSDNSVSADFRKFPISLSYDGDTMELVVSPTKHVCDFLVLGVANNGGIGLIKGSAACTVTIAANRLRAGALLSGESLANRDM
jgi:hypothetical protein